jgi:hypothetical protein
MNERLLTVDELGLILVDSHDPKYRITNLLHLGERITNIKRISQKTGLILVHGNSDTGYEHMLVRHHPMTKGIQKLDNPSQYSLDTIPIFDLLHIADSVFKSENKITDQRNKRPNTFDLFIGPHTDRKGNTIDYKLLLYRDTLVVHNLVPNKRTFTKKKIVDLVQGFCSCTSYVGNGLEIYRVPYYDSSRVQRAVVVIRLRTNTGEEHWDIQINGKDGVPILTRFIETRYVTSYLPCPSRCTSLEYHEDFSQIEKSIKTMLVEFD